VLRLYWSVVEGRAWHLLLPVSLILVAGVLEGASYSLLIPLTEAVSENSFDFLSASRWFSWILDLVPATVEDTGARDAFLVVLVVALIIAGRIGKLVVEYVGRLFVMGRIDAEIGWSSSVLGLLVAAEGLLKNAIGLLVKAGVMFGISIPLSIAFVLSLPFVNWFMNVVNREVERIARQSVEVDRRLRGRIVDLLGSIPLVKAYSQERAAAAAYGDVLREAEALAVRRRVR
jgi:ABC-type multidrug transport system fused ATPase/permease subunit